MTDTNGEREAIMDRLRLDAADILGQVAGPSVNIERKVRMVVCDVMGWSAEDMRLPRDAPVLLAPLCQTKIIMRAEQELGLRYGSFRNDILTQAKTLGDVIDAIRKELARENV